MYLITLEYKTNGEGGGGTGLALSTCLISRGEGKVKIDVFLMNWGNLEKLTRDGCSFGTR